MWAVTQLSRPHATHAAMISTAPTSTAAPGPQVSRTPATVINTTLDNSRRPMRSPKNNAASTTVATSSVFSRIDAVAASVLASPATSNSGPIAPPATTATAAGRHSATSACRFGGFRTTDGVTAAAAPT